MTYNSTTRTIPINPIKPLSRYGRYLVTIGGDFVAPGLEEGVGPRVYDSTGNIFPPTWWIFTVGNS